MGSQLLQNTEIIKQTDVLLEKSKENMDLSRIYLAVPLLFYHLSYLSGRFACLLPFSARAFFKDNMFWASTGC